MNRDLAAGVEAAWDAVNRGSPDAPGKVQKVLDAIKPAFI
ncbi:hypothetical protein J2Z49_001418 [Desulfofundulus luciae]|uniref:Uncharacterized protein n=1 Tax=Desulfofundulus luciae TaxID=74702 RepID=A0ABU0B0R1_9FIRM|nr:hypothetical protein [Desulfofundulus luciae]